MGKKQKPKNGPVTSNDIDKFFDDAEKRRITMAGRGYRQSDTDTGDPSLPINVNSMEYIRFSCSTKITCSQHLFLELNALDYIPPEEAEELAFEEIYKSLW